MTEARTEPYTAVEMIKIKRDGGSFDDAQLDWLIDGYVRSVIGDEQMAALAMAIYFRGFTAAELSPLDLGHDRRR